MSFLVICIYNINVIALRERRSADSTIDTQSSAFMLWMGHDVSFTGIRNEIAGASCSDICRKSNSYHGNNEEIKYLGSKK